MSRIEKVTQYWQQQPPTSASMFKRYVSPKVMEEEKNELLSYLPDFTHKTILDLPCGIGRFTQVFSAKAKSVTAVDLIPHFIEKNRSDHHDCPNVTFFCADALALTFPPATFDLIFINWLFLYLEDSEVGALLQQIHTWLKPKGHLFFRETCAPSPTQNPDPRYLAYYRPFRFYDELISSRFSTLKTGALQTYINAFADPFQSFWLCEKICVL